MLWVVEAWNSTAEGDNSSLIRDDHNSCKPLFTIRDSCRECELSETTPTGFCLENFHEHGKSIIKTNQPDNNIY
jgi:hypothetical protein